MKTDLELFNEFAEAAMLNKQHHPWRRRREDGQEYGVFEIWNCQHEDWWYNEFIGVKFMGLISRTPYYHADEVHPIQFIGKCYITEGRTIPITDLILT